MKQVIIDSDGKQCRPIYPECMFVDSTPRKGSMNPISSDAVFNAVGGATELPSYDESNEGQILKVKDDASGVEWANPPEELPSVANNAGKVLTVNAGADGVEWANTQLPEEKSLESTNNTISITEGTTTVSIDVANPLPSTLGTAGQLLTVNAGADGVEWANAPSGDVVVITLTATPTGTSLADFYNQVSTAVAANKQVVVKTIGTSVPNIRYFVLMDVIDVANATSVYTFNTIEIADASGTNKNIYGYRIRLEYVNIGSPSYNFSSTRTVIASGVPGSTFDPFH